MTSAEEAGVSEAEYAVLWHVRDTVVQPRDVLASWTAQNLPNVVASDITVDDCLRAIDSLIERGLLVELSAADIEADRARWRAEPLPVSWGVDRDRHPGDIDLTEAGFRVMPRQRSLRAGYNDESAGSIRVFGETEESCTRQLQSIVDRLPPGSFEVGPMQPLGPWWFSRFERVPGGFEARLQLK